MKSPLLSLPSGGLEYKSHLVAVFGTLFLAAGIIMLLRVPYLFHLKGRLDGGVEVPAKILGIELVSTGVGRGGSGSSISVEYQFWLHGKLFHGSRASVFQESNGLYFHLRNAFEAGRELSCFVDPHDPTMSALEKDISILDLVGTIALAVPCCVIGFLMLVRHFRTVRRR